MSKTFLQSTMLTQKKMNPEKNDFPSKETFMRKNISRDKQKIDSL